MKTKTNAVTETQSKLNANEAMWLWDDISGEMIVVKHSLRNKEYNYLPNSTGACWAGWKQDSTKAKKLFLLECVGEDFFSEACSLVSWDEVG